MKALPIRLSGLRGQMMTAFALKGAAAVFSFALNWLIARQFGAEGVGNFAVALTSAVLGSTLALAGLEYVLVRTVAVEHGAGRSGVARSAVRRSIRQAGLFALVLAGCMFLSRELIADRIMTEPGVAPFLGIMAIAIPIIAMAKLISAALRGVGRIAVSQSIDGPIGTGLTAAVLGGAILGGMADSPLLPAILYCLFTGLGVILGWLVLRRAMRSWAPAEPFPESLLRAGVPILCVAISNLFVDWFATLMLSAEYGAAEAGLFRIAFQIVATLNLMIATMEAILGPVIADGYAKGDRARIASVSRKAALAMLGLASPLLLVILIAPGWLMGLFGPEFVAGAIALQILAVGQTVNLLAGPVGTVLIMTRHERWALGYGLAGAALAASLCWFLIPAYGVIGAAIAVSATMIFRRMAALIIVRQVVGIHFFGRNRA